MNEKVTFWSPPRSARNSASLFLSFFKMMSCLSLLKVVTGSISRDPFSFTTSDGHSVCFYSLYMYDLSSANNAAVFASVVSSLLNGTLGPIIPTIDYVKTTSTMYCPTVCSEQLLLESNCSSLGAAGAFWHSLNDFIANDKSIEALKNCGSFITTTPSNSNTTLPSIVTTTSNSYILPLVLVIGLLLVAGAWALRNLYVNGSPENREGDLENGGQELMPLSNS